MKKTNTITKEPNLIQVKDNLPALAHNGRMKINSALRLPATVIAGALALSALSAFGQAKPFAQPGTAQAPMLLAPKPKTEASAMTGAGTNSPSASSSLNKFFNGEIPDAIAKGKFNLDVRLRYEQVDEEGVSAIGKNSYAPTMRTKFGYTTAPLYGFQGMLEGLNVTSFGNDAGYNAAGSNGHGDRPVVADPPLTRLDQAWLSWNYTNWFFIKAGEQRIVLDNQRFVGDVAWRQNIQTYEAVSLGSEPIKGLNLYYAYVWNVHRVFGDVAGLPAANTDFDSHSHLFNISYSGWKYGEFVGYTYLLDLHNAAGDANSSATYGGYFAGNAPVAKNVALNYRAEFAYQTDYSGSPLRYDATYYNLEAGVNIKPVSFGAGYEDLGSGANSGAGGGRTSFRTPLATLHAFNGWDDVFLATPANGLCDLYGYVQVIVPVAQVPIKFVFHKFDADHGDGDYGDEFDIVASKQFGKHWNALVKYAYYNGNDAAAPSLTVPHVDIQKFWAQVEFTF
ncbi:MAG TPA: hypothetical protein VFV23_02935 [Verrucomicrobiae bacterium]|nr:hypothetical protein [Verrucomicrobiae bacterium]